MTRRPLLLSALVAAALFTSACHLPSPMRATLTTSPVADAGTGTLGTLAVRQLVQGSFMLPPSLISVGSGSLVSVGSGGLVSVGSGGLVSVGSARYHVMALGQKPVADARVALATPDDAEVGVATRTGADGHYALSGDAPAGLYRVEATLGKARYLALAVVGAGSMDAAIDVATTLVATRLLGARRDGVMAVVPTQTYQQTVAAVRDALSDDDLGPDWTPDQAEITLSRLESKNPGVQAAMTALRDQQTALEHRAAAYQYRIQEMASQLGVPAPRVAGAVMAALSTNPTAPDDQIVVQARAEATSGGSGQAAPASSAPAASSAPSSAPSASPAGASPAPGRPSASPSSGAPSAAPTAAPSAEPSDGLPSTPMPDPTPTPTPVPSASPSAASNGHDGGASNGNAGNAATPSPAGSAAAGNGNGAPGPSGNPGNSGNVPTPAPASSAGAANGNGNANGAASGNGNANGASNGPAAGNASDAGGNGASRAADPGANAGGNSAAAGNNANNNSAAPGNNANNSAANGNASSNSNGAADRGQTTAAGAGNNGLQNGVNGTQGQGANPAPPASDNANAHN